MSIYLRKRLILKSFIVCMIFCSTTIIQAQKSDRCSSQLIMDGMERIVSYGLDTTNNWWAVTMPYDSMYRLYINGKQTSVYQRITSPIFAHDGEQWATFSKLNNQWYFILNGNAEPIPAMSPGSICFSGMSNTVAYSYFEGSQEIVHHRNRNIQVIGRVSPLFLSYNGSKLAFVIGQAGAKALVENGHQGSLYDDIIPIGYWTDGTFVYAARSGTQWRVVKGEEEIGGVFTAINDAVINLEGTVFAILGSQGAGSMMMMVADEYTRPITSKMYDNMNGLTLHPTKPLCAARAFFNGAWLVVMNTTEFGTGQQSNGTPYFTHDGSELLFVGCDADCFLSVNGKRILLNQLINPEIRYAHKPGSASIGFTSPTSLVTRLLEKPDTWLSIMCDSLTNARYNWRTNKYEAIGRITTRLHLISCKPD